MTRYCNSSFSWYAPFGYIRLASPSHTRFFSLLPLLLIQFGHIQAAVSPYAHKTPFSRDGFLSFNSYMPKTLIFSAFFFPFWAYTISFPVPCPTYLPSHIPILPVSRPSTLYTQTGESPMRDSPVKIRSLTIGIHRQLLFILFFLRQNRESKRYFSIVHSIFVHHFRSAAG